MYQKMDTRGLVDQIIYGRASALTKLQIIYDTFKNSELLIIHLFI